jgi:hypothetical protein
MGFDVAGDVAATMFARRGVGCIWQEVHVLVFREWKWAYFGGGSANVSDDLLADRPAVLPCHLALAPGAAASSDPQIIRGNGHGEVRVGGDGTEHRPGSEGWISYGVARVSARVTSVQISDRRLPVPWHGHVLLVWSRPPPPRVIARDEHERALGELLL